MDDIRSQIEKIEKEIASLPVGYISHKVIKGKVRQYLQWTEDGRKRSKYINDETAAVLEPLIERRRELQKELRTLKAQLISTGSARRVSEDSDLDMFYAFRTYVLTGQNLRTFTESVRYLRKRDMISALNDYINNDHPGKVFVLCGLRRTGKTTLIKQTIRNMSDDQFNRCAFVQLRAGQTLADLDQDMRWLASHGYKYVFIDEVTMADDFISGAALFSDIYSASGIKVVLSGTDSLGFIFTESEELYDRCIMQHTTFIPYKEFERVLGITGIDEYIRFGGTMSLGGTHYNEPVTFASRASTDEYIDSAIAGNIQHSLKNYQYGGHFRHLTELYDAKELTSAINRVIEDINHRFTIEVLTRDFKSHDLGISASNLRKDREAPTDILDRIDKDTLNEGLRNALEILNKPEQQVEITDAHRTEIKEYLKLLDLIVDIPIEFIPVSNDIVYRTVITQPGMRYSQAEALIRQLLMDEVFSNISASDRAEIIERILNEVRGRMMEEIILLETMKANPGKHVFKLQFAVGEIDMVVADPSNITCEIYEIKHSRTASPDQYRHLIDKKKCDAIEFRYGRITRKCVIYRGDAMDQGEVDYLNVEEYLRGMH